MNCVLLNMCDPLINIHELFEFFDQWNCWVIAHAIILYDIMIPQQYHLWRHNAAYIGVPLAAKKQPC